MRLSQSPTFKMLEARVDALSGVSTLAVYGTLAQAVVAINAGGATPLTELVINAPTTVWANTIVPPNIILKPEGACLITVDAGVTLTVGAMRDPGNRRIFNVASTGKVLFDASAVSAINLQWWVPRADFANLTTAFDNAYQSCANNDGGTVVIPRGNWLTSGEHSVPSNTTTMGVGGSRVFAAADNIAMFRVSGAGGRRAVNFDNFIINGYYGGARKTGMRGIVGNADGGQIYLLSAKRVIFEVVETAIHHEAATNGEGICWEFENCSTGDGTTSFKCDSVNSSQLFNNCRFHVDTNGVIFDLKYTGGFEANKCLFISVPNAAGGLPNSGGTVVKTFGVHNAIKFRGCQDEGVEYFLKTDVNDYATGLFILEENLIQSKIQPSADTTIYSRNNKYVWDNTGNVKANVASATTAFYSDDDEFTARVGNDPEVITENIGIFANGSFVARHVSRLNRRNKFTGNSQFVQKLISAAGESDTGVTPAFPGALRPALETLVEVNSSTHPGVHHPLLRMGVKNTANNETYGWEWRRDPSSGHLILQSNLAGYDALEIKLDYLVLKAVDGSLRKLVIAANGTVSTVAYP